MEHESTIEGRTSERRPEGERTKELSPTSPLLAIEGQLNQNKERPRSQSWRGLASAGGRTGFLLFGARQPLISQPAHRTRHASSEGIGTTNSFSYLASTVGVGL
jgi:hypothetical protein